jgi:RNA polymerase sigma-70 factor (ECF subfamily)
VTEARVDARRDLAAIEAAVLDLPEDLRAAFVLCQLEDLSSKEAAALLNTREGTVRRRLHDARRRLERAVEEASRS